MSVYPPYNGADTYEYQCANKILPSIPGENTQKKTVGPKVDLKVNYILYSTWFQFCPICTKNLWHNYTGVPFGLLFTKSQHWFTFVTIHMEHPVSLLVWMTTSV